MKIITTEATEVPITNVEVYEWLKEKDFTGDREREADEREAMEKEGKENELQSPPQSQTQSQSNSNSLLTEHEEKMKQRKFNLRQPHNTQTIARQLDKFLETCPSALVTSASLKQLYQKLKPFKLTAPELLMISNIRPEAYAHLEPLIVDVYSRFEEQQLVEMLEIINETLEPRTRDGVAPKWRKKPADTENKDEEMEEQAEEDDEVMKEAEHEEGEDQTVLPPSDDAPDKASSDEAAAELKPASDECEKNKEAPSKNDSTENPSGEVEATPQTEEPKKDKESKESEKEQPVDQSKPANEKADPKAGEVNEPTTSEQIDAVSNEVSAIAVDDSKKTGDGTSKNE